LKLAISDARPRRTHRSLSEQHFSAFSFCF
jgi:hypothetical protein